MTTCSYRIDGLSNGKGPWIEWRSLQAKTLAKQLTLFELGWDDFRRGEIRVGLYPERAAGYDAAKKAAYQRCIDNGHPFRARRDGVCECAFKPLKIPEAA
jgi:hypothetical protein